MQQIFIPYCYFIGWSKLGKFYYGVKHAKNANPSNFWKTYFTSSEYVKEMREQHGEPDIIQIRKTFKDGKSACMWEQRVLRRLNVLYKDNWLNKSICGSTIQTEEIKQKISATKMNKRCKPFKITCSDGREWEYDNACQAVRDGWDRVRIVYLKKDGEHTWLRNSKCSTGPVFTKGMKLTFTWL